MIRLRTMMNKRRSKILGIDIITEEEDSDEEEDYYYINRLARWSVTNGEQEVKDISTIRILNLSKYDISEQIFITIRDHYINVEELILSECCIKKTP